MVIAKSRLYSSSSSDGSIKEWDIEDLRRGCLKTVSAHKECAMCLAATKKILFSAGTDHTLRSWDLSTLEEIAVVERVHEGIVSAMVCSKEYVFTSSLGCIKVWDPVTLKEVHNIDGFSQSWVRALFYDKELIGFLVDHPTESMCGRAMKILVPSTHLRQVMVPFIH
eukprot:Em0019g1201a